MPNITIQNAEEPPSRLPSNDTITSWAASILQQHHRDNSETTIRFVTKAEMQGLNKRFRGIDKPTNVLSFPNHTPPEFQSLLDEQPYLGDVVICPDVVRYEALHQNKMLDHHLAHMIVHGCLHLLGYDHETNEEATLMESLEINHLSKFGISNPYQAEYQHEAPIS